MKRLFSYLSCLLATILLSIHTVNALSATVRPFPFLSQMPTNTTNRIFQDKEGFIWLGTSDGLCRYDGYNLQVYRTSPSQPSLLANNNIKALNETKDGKLLIGMWKGLCVFDKKTHTFTNLKLGSDLEDYEVRGLAVDKQGYIWIASFKKLMRLSPDLKELKSYGSLPVVSCNDILVDDQGHVWASFWNKGLYRYNEKRDVFVKMPKLAKIDNPFRIYQDLNHRYWITSWDEGIFRFYPENKGNAMYEQVHTTYEEPLKRVYRIVQASPNGYLWMVGRKGLTAYQVEGSNTLLPKDIGNIPMQMNNIFNDLVLDRSGNFWIASTGMGGYMLNLNKTNVTKFVFPKMKEMFGMDAYIAKLYVDKSGLFWMEQNAFGLCWYNPHTRQWKTYKDLHLAGGEKNLGVISYMASLPSRPSEVWVCPKYKKEIYIFQSQGGNPVYQRTENLAPLKTGNPKMFVEDKTHRVWISTERGIAVRLANGSLRKVKVDIPDISSLTQDKEGNLWVASSSQGLYKLTPAKGGNQATLQSIRHFTQTEGGILSNHLNSVCMDDNRHILWIGSLEGHFFAYHPTDDKVQDYSPEFASYINETVGNIQTDRYGHVWIATAKNIIEYNPSNKNIRAYLTGDESGISFFSAQTLTYDGDKNIYCGGAGGIVAFDAQYTNTPHKWMYSPLVTDVKVHGVSVMSGKLSEDYHIDTEKKSICLGPEARDVELDFSILDYTNPQRILYAYRIKGINKDWIYVSGDHPRAYYSELPKGNYTLELRATDAEGHWQPNIVKFEIERLPAWYESGWAYSLYIIVLLAAGYYILQMVKRRIILKNKLRIAEMENQKNEELTQSKLRYFTNVSHDFLTPISIISCLIDDMGMTYKNHIPQLDNMRTNLDKLKRLIQQILDFRKIENGKMTLKVSKNDLTLFVRKVCQMNFEPLMRKKHINFTFETEEEQLPAYFDGDKLEKVLYNLLSNAYKYTEEGGEIHVTLQKEDGNGHPVAVIKVQDNGKGISPEAQKHIFTRFYTANKDKDVESNGIGLALVKEIIELHHGEVFVRSQEGKGSEFSVRFPIDEASYSEQEKISAQEAAGMKNLELTETASAVVEPLHTPTEELETMTESSVPQDNSTILIVDDNEDLLNVMNRIFSRRRKVLLAHNGKEALDIVHQNETDLIISDVMMPEMDGLALCHALKSDIETSHIPVILLTAKNSPEDRVDCYKAGADGFIAKPFELNVLEARIENFLHKKKDKQQVFNETPKADTEELGISPLDKEFLDKVVGIIETNMQKAEDVDINTLATEVYMSKSTLYRKIKSVTGLSPIDFVKNIRLKKAYELLLKNEMSIADVAYYTGFSSPKYFATRFKEQFGMTPSDFMKQQREK